MIREFKGKKPVVAENAIVDEAALIMGNVIVGDGASVWPHALIRADDEPVIVERGVAILEKAFIEAPRKVVIGEGSIISHGAIVHGSIIGKNVLVGIGAVVLEVSVGENSIIAAGAVVTKDVPPYTMVAGTPAREIRKVDERDMEKLEAMRQELREKAFYLKRD